MAIVEKTSVLIAGAGATGMTAALELMRFGIPARLIDQMEAPAITSRAVGVQARTLEEMELRGLADQFVRLGHPAQGGSIYGAGKRIFRLDFTRIESRYNFLLFLSQAETERILREALATKGVAIERGVRMVAFAQQPFRVTATLQHRDGSLEEVSTAFLISAEGAHGIVRSSLDLPFKGRTLDESYALGDLQIDGDLPDSDFHIFSSEHGFVGLFPMGGSHFRLIASNPISKPSKDTEPGLEELQTIYDQRSHIPAQFRELIWSSWFHINSRMVERLKIGRVFLAGDAAHIHSPAGAQGMNTGMQDMMNLGWKLALVLKDKASERLLDTYEQDRIPVMRSVLTRAEGLTEIIGAENPMVRGVFNHLAPWIAGTNFVQENATDRMSQLALSYRESPLSEDHHYDGSLHAGDRVPDLPLQIVQGNGEREDRRLFSLLDPSSFTLLFVNISDAAILYRQIVRVLEPWRELIEGVWVEPPSGAGQNIFREHFGSVPMLLLIRPDGYIGFRGSEHLTQRLAEYCRRWLSPATEQRAA